MLKPSWYSIITYIVLTLLATVASTITSIRVLAQDTTQFATVTVAVLHDSVPLPGARIRTKPLTDNTGGVADTARAAVTNTAGRALLRLTAGTYQVMVSKLGFMPESVTVTLREWQDTTLALVLHQRPTQVDEIVITATRTGRRIQDEPLRVEVLTREEIEEKTLMTPGDITMMLNETSGLRVQTTSPSLGGANVRIQGLLGRYTQMLSDGLPLYGGQAGSLGLLQIPPMDLGQVEVIKGAASALYGASALGGVVNLVSRRPARDRELLLNQTTRNGTDVISYTSNRLSPAWGYTLLGGYHRQLPRDVSGDGWADMAGYDRGVIRPRLFWTSQQGHTAFLTAGGTVEEREGGTLGGSTSPDGQPFEEGLRTRRFDMGGVGRWILAMSDESGEPVSSVSIRGSITEQRHRHRFGSVTEHDVHRTWFTEAAWNRIVGSHNIVSGVALQQDVYGASDVSGFDFTYTIPALFVQDDYTVNEHFGVMASGRVDRHSEYGIFFNPRLSALVRLAPAWTLRSSVGVGFFAPTPFTEETEATGLTPIAPLRQLKAERATSASLDLGGLMGDIELNATLFGSNVRHPVSTRILSTPANTLELVNAAEPTRTRGAELLIRYKKEPWHLTSSYTHLRSTQFDVDMGARREVALTPRHAVGIVSMWEEHDVGRVGLEVYYTGKQPLENNPYRTKSKQYVLLGLLAERQFGAGRFFINLENLLGVRQTRYDPLLLPARGRGGRWTTDVWAPLEGRVINAGVRLSLGQVDSDHR